MTTARLAPDIQNRIDALVAKLRSTAAIRSSHWARAFTAIPRHVFLPRPYTQDTNDQGITVWRPLDLTDRDRWLDAIYQDQTLVTALDEATAEATGDGGFTGVPTSSSTLPSLMARMLDDLDVAYGHRVLEIGTGTGYNAALLTHRLGAANVYSIDIDPANVDAARSRLAAVGHAPTLIDGDGRDGYPPGAPYDRIIATCSVPAIPPAWLEQVRPGGTILTDVASRLEGGLVRLIAGADGTAQGRFTAGGGRFMPVRDVPHTYAQPVRTPGAAPAETRPSPVAAIDVQTHHPFRLLLAARLPAAELVYHCDDNTGAMALQLQEPDGTWAHSPLPGQPGTGTITWGGSRDLWQTVEDAWNWWNTEGQPDHTRFGITATAGGTTTWYRQPGTELTDPPGGR